MGVELLNHGIGPQDGPFFWFLAGGSWVLFVLLFYGLRSQG